VTGLPISRRLALLLPFGLAGNRARAAEDVTVTHALSVLGKPALPADFPYFPYVNPDAPKGGEVRFAAIGTFDNFNPFILRGTAPLGLVGSWVILPGGAGSGASVGHLWESLLTTSANEADAAYCHIAHRIELPGDRMWVGFELNPAATFSDGTPVMAQDVAWSFNNLMEQGRPAIRIQFNDVRKVEVVGDRHVVFHFKSNENRELPMIVGGLPVLPRHFFAERDFTRPLSDPPIGSGPYRIASFEMGRNLVFERNPDWWARDLPTGRGTNNFDRVRIDYYRELTVALEAFKAGQVEIRAENTAARWATAYDFPAVKQGLVIKKAFTHHLPTGLQGWAMNTRRPMFSNPLVRNALGLVYDFQWANKNLFYGQYTRSDSYFQNSDLASSGIPQGDELKLLESFRDELPPALFTEPFTLPVTDGSGNNRPQLMQALGLMKQAGWQVKDRKLVDASGQQMSFTILLADPGYERVALPYIQDIQHLGIDARARTVDPAQYQHLMDNFDFDMTLWIYPESDVPGNELRDYFSCAAAKTVGSSNAPGVCDPAVDAMVERIVRATNRPELLAAAHALDRVLLWRWYMVPNYGNQQFWVAYWNRFGYPDKPIRDGVNFDIWWVDSAKAAATDKARRQ
jgi:microcin C transport system substrate-binding protein